MVVCIITVNKISTVKTTESKMTVDKMTEVKMNVDDMLVDIMTEGKVTTYIDFGHD
jgi:hypothetical protein